MLWESSRIWIFSLQIITNLCVSVFFDWNYLMNKINIHMIHVSRLCYKKYWFKLIAKHYIMWMNFNVMSQRFYFDKPLTQCRWFLLQDFLLPSSWYGLVGNHIATFLFFEKRTLMYFNKLFTFNSIPSGRWYGVTSLIRFIDHFKKGVSCFIVNRLLIFINNSAKDQYFLYHHKRNWFQFLFFNLILKNGK